MWPISSCLTSGGRVPDQGNSGERELPNIFDTDDLIDEFDRDDDVSDLIIDAEESHRGAFGDYGGESGGLIERTFRERIVLVGVTLAGDDPEETDASLDELALLVDTAGADALDRVVQRRSSPDAATYVGSGKAKEIKAAANAIDADTVVFDDETTQELERRYVFGEWRDEPLAEGTKIECRYRDTATFYPGAVAKANDDGTHDITYDDGEAEAGVILRRLRRPGQQQPENVDAGSRVDARRPDGPPRLAIVLPALRTWITQKAALAPTTQWGLIVLRDAEAELLLAPTERDIMLATLNSVAQPRPRDAFEEEDDGVADAPFDFSSLYNVLGDACGTARPAGAVDRCLVVFGRSRAVPVATGEFTLKAKGHFFLDAI